MALDEIRKLGDPVLLEKAEEVFPDELPALMPEIEKMWRLISEFRQVYGRGRAIAAPQIGLLKRIICLDTDRRHALVNPVLTADGDEMMELWDDCMSFPNLLVRLKRFRRVTITFRDTEWNEKVWKLSDDMSELIQHEYDHLDGILAISRAENISCFRWTD